MGRTGGSGWDTVFSLLARRSGWECCVGSGRVWLLSFLLGTYFGDSKKNTDGGRVRGQFDEDEVPRQETCPTEETAWRHDLPMSESLWFLMISPSSK